MTRLRRSSLVFCLLLLGTTGSHASPADAKRIEKTWSLQWETWTLEARAAATPEARAAAAAKRPDVQPFLREMWLAIRSSLDQPWTLDHAAWFLNLSHGLPSPEAGAPAPPFSAEVEQIRKAIESHHLKSPALTPVCMALTHYKDPRSLAILEKIQTEHPDPKVQGVAAMAAALVLKSLGDDAEIMRKRLTNLRKAIVQSSGVDLGGGNTVAKLAEDELYIIRFLTKGRQAPDLAGIDSAGRPLKLSDFGGKVVLLMFWSSSMAEFDRVVQITNETARKFEGREFEILGVNLDPLDKLRTMEADGTVSWRSFSDPSGKLAAEFRVKAVPAVLVLDGQRTIQFTGTPGSFAELTAEALLSENPAAPPASE